MEFLLMLLGAALAGGFGYIVGWMFNQNKYGVKFKPELWALLGFLFGLQGLLAGAIYGLCKVFFYVEKK